MYTKYKSHTHSRGKTSVVSKRCRQWWIKITSLFKVFKRISRSCDLGSSHVTWVHTILPLLIKYFLISLSKKKSCEIIFFLEDLLLVRKLNCKVDIVQYWCWWVYTLLMQVRGATVVDSLVIKTYFCIVCCIES